MIYHCIRFTLKPGVSEADRVAGLAQMREHINAIPSIKARVVGPDFGGEFDYGAVSLIEDLQGYEEYMNHPAHLAMDRAGLPLVDRFVSFDITDDPDPEVGAKIAEIHRRRYENMPTSPIWSPISASTPAAPHPASRFPMVDHRAASW